MILLSAISLPFLQNRLAGEKKCFELTMKKEVSYLCSSSEVLSCGFMLESLRGLLNTDYLPPEILI